MPSESVQTRHFQKVYNTTCKAKSKEIRPYSVYLDPGFYKVELWGASGGGLKGCSGNGGYATAILNVTTVTRYFIYVGSQGEHPFGGCNGGGNGYFGTNTARTGSGGGGSTDLRMSTNIESRILVASGGGGCNGGSCYGGAGGSETGFPGSNVPFSGLGGNQTHGGAGGFYYFHVSPPGSKLEGGSGIGFEYSAGGGGGGFYGGGGSYECGGGGGSGYISPDLKGFLSSGKETFASPYHWKEIGHYGNGAARITLINGYPAISCGNHHHYNAAISVFFYSFSVIN